MATTPVNKAEPQFLAEPTFSGKPFVSDLPGDLAYNEYFVYPDPSPPLATSFKLSGSLLYLSPNTNVMTNPPVLPIWIQCTATLESSGILVSWVTSSETPFVQSIDLSYCTDVRSLSVDQLGCEERAQLPSGVSVESLKIFEVIFGEPRHHREVFAAESVRNRAAWINAIWDTIIPSQETRSRLAHPELRPIPSVKPNYMSSEPSCKPTQRALPPIPACQPPGQPATRSPSVHYPTRVASTAGTADTADTIDKAPCASPSVVELVRRSTVKQRVAELQTTFDRQSPKPSSPLKTQMEKCATGHDSILDCYDDAIQISPTPKPGVLSPPLVPPTLSSPQPDSAPPSASAESVSSVHPKPTAPRDTTNEVVDLVLLQAAKHQDQATTIGSHLLDLKAEIVSLRNELPRMVNADVLGTLRDMSNKLDTIARKQSTHPTHGVRASFKDAAESLGKEGQLDAIIGTMDKISSEVIRVKDVVVPAVEGISEIAQKLKQLEEKGRPAVNDASPSPVPPNTEISEILDLLKAETAKLELQGNQQADSVRYLNELNSWLEAFMSQNQSVTNNINGLHDQLMGVDGGPQGTLPQVHQLLCEIQTSGVFNNGGYTMEYIAGMIEHHRQDQDALIGSLISEVVSEVRGERLKFIDAMKEATAINVRKHVEEFKKEMTQEVRGMVNEVNRLHRERQVVENQIVDLFTFYSKQRQPLSVTDIKQCATTPGRVDLSRQCESQSTGAAYGSGECLR